MSKQSTVSPIDDLTFDVLTVLREKAKALAAYDKYLSDADAEDDDEVHDLFLSMRKQDEEHVQVLKEVLARRLEDDLGYEDEGEDEDDTDDDDIADALDDEDELVEDYDEADADAVEEPAAASSPASRGDDAAVMPGTPSPPRRGESTQRHR